MHQKGFAHAFLIIGLMAALIGALVFIAWQNFIYEEPETSTSEVIVQKHGNSRPTKDQQSEEDDRVIEGYLVINEWGIKIKTSVAEKIEYAITSHPGGTESLMGVGPIPYERLGIKIKTDALVNKTCADPGADLYRSQSTLESRPSRELNGYNYYIGGAPGLCSDHVSDQNLQFTLLDDVKLDHIEAL